MEGLSLAGNIQGVPADTFIAIFKANAFGPALKWVDDFVLFRTPSAGHVNEDGITEYVYSYDLSAVMAITDPLGIPWHPIDVKGQDFKSTVSYVGFVWDLEHHSVSLSPKKRLKYLDKVCSLLHASSSKISCKDCMSILGTLQHISFIYKEGHSLLLPFSSFLSKFHNDFACRHVPHSITESFHWWEAVLSKPSCSCSLMP